MCQYNYTEYILQFFAIFDQRLMLLNASFKRFIFIYTIFRWFRNFIIIFIIIFAAYIFKSISQNAKLTSCVQIYYEQKIVEAVVTYANFIRTQNLWKYNILLLYFHKYIFNMYSTHLNDWNFIKIRKNLNHYKDNNIWLDESRIITEESCFLIYPDTTLGFHISNSIKLY